MRIDRVYTRGGDTGKTSLIGGARVHKSDKRIRAFGNIDELNAFTGMIIAITDEAVGAVHHDEVVARTRQRLVQIQHDLFIIGGQLATPDDTKPSSQPRLQADHTASLERWIDELNGDLEPLVEFVLPSGGRLGVAYHQARTVCRRAERDVVELCLTEVKIDDEVLRYLNRLSDFFFVCGRWVAKTTNCSETVWNRTL